jgi:hypothetical protein
VAYYVTEARKWMRTYRWYWADAHRREMRLWAIIRRLRAELAAGEQRDRAIAARLRDDGVLEAARNRIGSPWRRPTEMPESGRRIAVLWADGAIVAFIGVHAVIDIWSHASAWCYLEPPPWVEEGSHGH